MKKSSNLPVLLLLILIALGGLILLAHRFVKRHHFTTTPPAGNSLVSEQISQTNTPQSTESPSVHRVDTNQLPELIEEIKDPRQCQQVQALAEKNPFMGKLIATTLAKEYIYRQENPPVWTDTDCSTLPVPPQNFGPLTCRKSQYDWCAFFENGRPYYCQNKEGTLIYLANKWASSQTLRHLDATGNLFLENYYANGQLSRTQETNSGVTSQIWWGNSSFRLNQTDVKTGKILDKFYFWEGKPYVRYPGGNDMGEINGEWEIKDGKIFIDGEYFYTLPEKTPAPDVCALFSGVCQSAQTQPEQELL